MLLLPLVDHHPQHPVGRDGAENGDPGHRGGQVEAQPLVGGSALVGEAVGENDRVHHEVVGDGTEELGRWLGLGGWRRHFQRLLLGFGQRDGGEGGLCFAVYAIHKTLWA